MKFFIRFFDLPFSKFYDKYVKYLSFNKTDAISKIAVSKLLATNKIHLTIGSNNIRSFEFEAEELCKIFNSKKWIHNIDDIHQLYFFKYI